ncbi:type 1 glutamine amidotransferase domain-containing protein [Sphingomonas bacterium]|uniref:type 1 glutamine amidotransferase domain-containing protein n=1 Tax=Sphingomonas bacterium TaxID=1895847 RepID=UPI002632F8D7|nr:type 1 glutamine amidotransferase domain-containing protein [Sphingomonas bacterium]MDB5679243.1 thiJ/pfpI-family protein [Sphingomonas bacterium]
MATVLFPIPARDFDPTEVAVSWRVLTGAGHRVRFATPDGEPGAADSIMLDGVGLDPWGKVPGLRRVRLLGLLLRANRDARRAYAAMLADPHFRAPIRWDDARIADFDGLLLAGGHRPRGMREYLESATLQGLVASFFAAGKPVASICHGVLLAARSRDAAGRSVLHGRCTTALTWRQEKAADGIARIGRWWDRDYYRTYPDGEGRPRGYMSVEHEVTRALASPADFVDVPANAPDHRRKTDRVHRDTAGDPRPAWVVVDGNYVSARWPGDAHTFAATFARLLS